MKQLSGNLKKSQILASGQQSKFQSLSACDTTSSCERAHKDRSGGTTDFDYTKVSDSTGTHNKPIDCTTEKKSDERTVYGKERPDLALSGAWAGHGSWATLGPQQRAEPIFIRPMVIGKKIVWVIMT